MGVFLPTAALGNSHMLACFGGKGELMAFFAPAVDFAQNVRECLPGLWLPDAEGGRFVYSFDGAFESEQRFLPSTNVLETRLTSQDLGVVWTFTDLAHDDTSALVRHVRLETAPGREAPLRVRFANYFRFALGECDEKNAVHYLPEHNLMRQIWRDHCITVCTSEPFAFQCGKVREDGSHVKWDMTHGHLSGQEQDLGRVDFAIGLDQTLEPGDPWEFSLILAFDPTEEDAIEHGKWVRGVFFEDLLREASSRSRTWLAPLVRGSDGPWKPDLERALLTIRDLWDEYSGAMVAAPEFDPTFELSGGYGFCWPRDGAEVVGALAKLGEMEIPRRALLWCVDTQLDTGHWYQRYWSDGSHAPSWCVYDDFYQLDQTCVTLRGMAEFADLLAGSQRKDFIAATSECVARGIAALKRTILEDDLHETAADLWEVHRGSFTYTNAALHDALRSAERVYEIDAEGLPERIKAAVLAKLWIEDEGRFARGLNENRDLDMTYDSSTLGVFDPFSLLDLAVPAERAMAECMVGAIEEHLAVPVEGGDAILRFQWESYMGGGPAAVNTLWTARAHLRLAKAGGPDEVVREHVAAAERYVRTALRHATPTGQLPELIPWNGYPYWAAPHGWASALLVDCLTALQGV